LAYEAATRCVDQCDLSRFNPSVSIINIVQAENYDEKKQKGKGKNVKGNLSSNNKSKCNWCGIPNHTENDCRRRPQANLSERTSKKLLNSFRRSVTKVTHLDAKSGRLATTSSAV